MPMTKAESRALFLRYLDEATSRGDAVPAEKNADYRDKHDYFLDVVCRQLAGMLPIPAVLRPPAAQAENLLGSGFFRALHRPGVDLIYETAGAAAYYFEMEPAGLAVLERYHSGGWEVLQQIQGRPAGKPEAFRGNLTVACGRFRLRFTGAYPYQISNPAVYPCRFPTQEEVPAWTPLLPVRLPADFRALDAVLWELPDGRVQPVTGLRWEGSDRLLIPRGSGRVAIHYFRLPAAIAPDAPDATPIDLPEPLLALVPLRCAAEAVAAENPALSAFFNNLFDTRWRAISAPPQPPPRRVETVYAP